MASSATFVKYTQYFLHTRLRPDRAAIKDEWIAAAIERPIKTTLQSDGRIRKWTRVAKENKFLRIVLLEDGATLHNAFFDRDFIP